MARSSKSALLESAIEELSLLPAPQQDAIATQILADLRAETDPATARFQELVAAKYTRRLTMQEKREMQSLEAAMEQTEAAFYGPILARVRSSATAAGKKRRIA